MNLSDTEFASRLIPLDGLSWNPSAPGKPAAVLVPLLRLPDSWEILFTVRSEFVANHRGQVSFPGGARDPQDVSPADTALRETNEEIGVPPDGIRLLGGLEPSLTSSNYQVVPIVGMLDAHPEIRMDPREVWATFSVPLNWFLEAGFPEWRQVPAAHAKGRRIALYYPPFQAHTIWGVTAELLHGFFRRLFPDNVRLSPPAPSRSG